MSSNSRGANLPSPKVNTIVAVDGKA
jgi:hypothetical protein